MNIISKIKRKIKLSFPELYIKKCTRINRKHSKMDEQEIRKELCRLYKYHLCRDLDWSNLQRYTEKMQWKKLYCIDPLERIASDKYAVRKWVQNKIGEEYLIPILGVWDRFEDINFDVLPEKFVLKATHASSTNIVVKNKNHFDKKMAALKFKCWLSFDHAFTSFEMNYKDIPRKIIAEKYLSDENGELPDYKFLCFDGVPYYCWVDKGRFTNHTRDIFDMDWNLQPWQDAFPNSGLKIQKPKNFNKMKEIVKILCKGFLHVRVDLYNLNGVIYFGELTFCESSGFCLITPDSYDYKLGQMWNLPIKTMK